MSCSTVERHSYFSPSTDVGKVEGPKKQSCGMAQFSDEPDTAIYNDVKYSANESYEPYLFGPWLITVIPVFPITWIADIFINPDLKISYESLSDTGALPVETDINIDVTQDGISTKIKPSSVHISDRHISATFPIEANQVDAFSIPTKDGNNIYFEQTSRWAWTQICIN